MLLPFHRTLHLGSRGYDVEAAKRATYRLLANEAKWQGYLAQTKLTRTWFGGFFRRDLILLQRRLTAGSEGVFDRETLRAVEDAGGFDGTARALWLLQYQPPTPVLVEPKQGFRSLDSTLWEAYSVGRRLGLSDLGTYNPASRLPSGTPSDHAVFPAFAFDLGVSPQNGFDNPTGRRFFELMEGRPGIHYVILGDLIWSTEKGRHAYTAGGHENHCHVSGVRP